MRIVTQQQDGKMLMNPLKMLTGSAKPDADVLALRGTRVPKFERSVIHAACIDGRKIIDEVHAVDDPNGVLLTEYLETAAGKKLLEGWDGYLLHVLSKRVRT